MIGFLSFLTDKVLVQSLFVKYSKDSTSHLFVFQAWSFSSLTKSTIYHFRALAPGMQSTKRFSIARKSSRIRSSNTVSQNVDGWARGLWTTWESWTLFLISLNVTVTLTLPWTRWVYGWFMPQTRPRATFSSVRLTTRTMIWSLRTRGSQIYRRQTLVTLLSYVGFFTPPTLSTPRQLTLSTYTIQIKLRAGFCPRTNYLL